MLKYVLSDEFLNEQARSCGPRDKDKVPSHLSPDLLSNEHCFSLDAPGTRPVWISVDIPSETPAGIYKGTISRRSASGTVTHTITLEVLNQQLPPPSQWSFHLDLWQNPFAVARFHHVKLWSKEHLNLLRPLLTKLANAGQKCITTTLIDKPWNGGACYDAFGSMINWTRKKDGKWAYDYTVFDTYVSLAMECGINKQINCYSMVPISNKFSWYDERTSKTVDIEAIPGTDEYENLWRGFLIDFRAHLKQKGWLDITNLALDEREEQEMKNMFRFLKETAPEFKIAMAGFYYEAINPLIYDFSSNWRYTDSISGSILESRKESGLKTTYYVACGIPKPNNFTFSPPSESCYEGWFAAAEGYQGFLRWAYNSWPENPLIDSRYIKWPSGDTYLVYPGARSSVRFERLREGIQDFEKIKILREELAQSDSKNAARALKRLNDFLDSVDAHTLDHKTAAEVINEGKQILYEIVSFSIPGKAGEKLNQGKRKDPPVQSMKYYIEQIRPDFKIGVYLKENPENNIPYLDFIKNNFNAVTIGVYMKTTQKSGATDWHLDGIDARIPFAEKNNMKIKFHPGIGPNTYNPDWLINGGYSATELTNILHERFRKLIERYKGPLKAFELVNEAVARDATGKIWDTTDNVWMDIGWSGNETKYPLYVEEAFRTGEKYSDDVELILNDNNNSMPQSTRSDNFYKAVKILLEHHIPVGGVGLQLHCSVVDNQLVESAFGNGSRIDTAAIKEMIKKYGELGVDVHITEFDVHLPEKPSASDYEIQAKAYRDVLKAALESPYCKSFTTWGTADPEGWAPKGYNPHSLWLDDTFQPKKNYDLVLEMLQEMAAGDVNG